MKLVKKLVAAACALALLEGASEVLPESFEGFGAAVNVSAESSGDFEYSVLDDGTAEITGYKGVDAEVTVPDEIGGRKVTSIGKAVFSYCENLTGISIPDSVVSISSYAFYCCKGLTRLTIPDSVVSIGDYAVCCCKNIESITIPDSVESIGISAFEGCLNLTDVIIPESVKSIGDNAFYDCKSLSAVTVPDSVESIGVSAFGFYYDTDIKNKAKLPGFRICCFAGTAGHRYAINNGFDLEYLGPALPGDADGNAKVNMKDLVLLQRYLNGWDVDIDLTVCDLTGDNNVNMKDYVALQRLLNGWT